MWTQDKGLKWGHKTEHQIQYLSATRVSHELSKVNMCLVTEASDLEGKEKRETWFGWHHLNFWTPAVSEAQHIPWTFHLYEPINNLCVIQFKLGFINKKTLNGYILVDSEITVYISTECHSSM